MEESDGHLLCSWTWSLVDETDSLAFSLYESLSYSVFYCKGYVVYALAALFEPLGDGRLR